MPHPTWWRGPRSAFWVRTIVPVHSELGPAWCSLAGQRWFVYLRMQCGSSEFIRGDVEGGFLPGVPWSAPKPACECPQPSRPQGSWFGPCRPLPAGLQVFCL